MSIHNDLPEIPCIDCICFAMCKARLSVEGCYRIAEIRIIGDTVCSLLKEFMTVARLVDYKDGINRFIHGSTPRYENTVSYWRLGILLDTVFFPEEPKNEECPRAEFYRKYRVDPPMR
jgi:hypothetical protein